MATKNDENIKRLLAKVEEQQSGLGVKPKSQWATNGLFKTKDMTFNLNTVRDSGPLVDALAHLIGHSSARADALKRLEIKAETYTHDGYTVADWEKDFKLRLAIVAWEGRKSKLEDTQKALKAMRSEDLKTEDSLADIENLLK